MTELPRRIKPLDPQLVNRIAAGEIIQRPFNALKELIENCLDAGSTSVNIHIKEGGLKLIQIQDNGCGIDKEDLKIVCERFTTSKLKEFEDLKSINTFGFRGEALASISHVSRLTITTKTANSPCAFKASYSEGKLTAEGIKPCASANKGTQIMVEDLFYNSSIRRNALRNGSEEFAKIYEVVSKYAIQNYHASFVLKRVGENQLDLKTSGCQMAPIKTRCEENESYLLDTIGIIYGNDLKKELLRISIPFDDIYKFEMNGFITNSKYNQMKQMIFILFINERLVDCQPIKKALQTALASYLPKNGNSFVYMNLKMNPENLDVNIHPTKHEVRFLYQDEIINRIQQSVEQRMLDSSSSRNYYMRNLTLDTFVDISNASKKSNDDKEETNAKSKQSNDSIVYPYQLTRVDSRERKLDSFLHSTALNDSLKSIKDKNLASKKIDESVAEHENNSTKKLDEMLDDLKSPLRNQKLHRSFNFKSLNELKESIEKNVNLKGRKKLLDMNFVGCLDGEMALIQHQTGLFLANTRILSEELFYQLAVFNFGNFGYFKLEEDLPVSELAFIALEDPQTEWTPEDGPKEKLAKRCAKFLFMKSQMLDDYFSIKFSKKLNEETQQEVVVLEALPMLMEDYEPNLIDLPFFLIRLATEVDWDEEKECFDSICREIAQFYSIKSIQTAKVSSQEEVNRTSQQSSDNEPASSNQSSSSFSSSLSSTSKPKEEWLTEHVMFKAFRNFLLPSNENIQQTFFKLVDLSKLYKVFERC